MKTMYGIRPNEIYKALGTLKGILKGMAIDGDINQKEKEELKFWSDSNSYLRDVDSDVGIVLRDLDDLLSKEAISQEQIMSIYKKCRDAQKSDKHQFYNPIVQASQELEGIIHGCLCDNELTYDEILGIREWLDQRYEFMAHSWPYDVIVSVIEERASDQNSFTENCEWMFAYFSIFADTKSSINLNGEDLAELRKKHGIMDFYDTCKNIIFKGRRFCFTGRMMGYERSELAEIVMSLGGYYTDKLTQDVNFLVIGSLGSPEWSHSNYGNKVLTAIRWKSHGKRIKIIREKDFVDAVAKKLK